MTCSPLPAANREMRQIQDDEARSNYWEPTRRIAVVPRHLKTPLAQALLFDISINFGLGDGFLRIAEREFGVAERSRVDQNGIGEAQLITRVAELRKLSHDRQASRDNLPGLRARGEFWLNLVRAGDWQLHGDAKGEIVVKNRPLQVRAPDLSHGDSQPGLDPDRFYVSPTENRVRIREQPETGITLAMTGFGDLLEIAGAACCHPRQDRQRARLAARPQPRWLRRPYCLYVSCRSSGPRSAGHAPALAASTCQAWLHGALRGIACHSLAGDSC